MKTTTTFGVVVAMIFAIISTASAQFAVSVDTSAMSVNPNSVDSIGIAHTNSPDTLTAMQLEYVQGTAQVSTGYQSMNQVLSNTGAGVFYFDVTGLIAGKPYTFWVRYCGFGSVTACPGYSVAITITTPGPPDISLQPVGSQVNEGAPFALNVGATGNPSTFAYQWQKGPSALGPWTDISGAIDSFYTVASATAADDAWYRVLVGNGQGSPTPSNAVKMTIVLAPTCVSVSPSSPVTVNAGTQQTITVSGTGATLTHKWTRPFSNNPSMVWDSDSSIAYTPGSSADTTTFMYVRSNSAGSCTTYVRVDVLDQLATYTVAENENADGGTVTVTVDPHGVIPTDLYLITSTDTMYEQILGAGATAVPFVISGQGPCTNVPYSLLISNSAGQVTSNTMSLTTSSVPPSGTVNQGATATSSTIAIDGNFSSICSAGEIQYRLGTSQSNLTYQVSSWVAVGMGSNAFQYTFTGLPANTTFYIQPRIKDQSGVIVLMNMIAVTTSSAPVTYNLQINNVDAYQSTSLGPVFAFTLTTNDPSMQFRTKAGPDPNLGLGSVVNNWQSYGAVTGMDITIPLSGLQPGTNYVTLQYKGAYTNFNITTTDTIPILILGVEEAKNGSKIKVFPNPATDFIMIETQNKGEITFSNMLGEVVKKEALVSGVNTLKVSELPKGVYFYQMEKATGRVVVE